MHSILFDDFILFNATNIFYVLLHELWRNQFDLLSHITLFNYIIKYSLSYLIDFKYL